MPVDYFVALKSKKLSLSTVEEIGDFVQWLKENATRLKTHKPPIAPIIGNLWLAMSYSEKSIFAEKVVFLDVDHPWIFERAVGLSSIAAQFILEKKMLRRLNREDQRIGRENPTRLIAIHPEELNDPEVQDAVYLQLKKHKPTCCLITTTLEGLKKILAENKSINTVVPIGHGFLPLKGANFHCGPIKGAHDDVAKTWGSVILSAPEVKHLRMVSCYYGAVNPKFDDKIHGSVSYNIKKHPWKTGRVTASVTYNSKEPLPFAETSMAAIIWQKVVVEGKRQNFCLSATPHILNPLPAKMPVFFAASGKCLYERGDKAEPVWDASVSSLEKVKAIRLGTEDSEKLKKGYEPWVHDAKETYARVSRP